MHRSIDRRPLAATFALLLALPGCSGGGDYPSLARRPAEIAAEKPHNPPVTPPAPPAPLDPALAARLDALVARARKAHARFLADTPVAERRVAAGEHGAVGSDAWSAANSALSSLESARSDAGIALGELEQVYSDDRVANALADANAGSNNARPDGAAIDAARSAVLALVDAEDATLAGLRAHLPG